MQTHGQIADFRKWAYVFGMSPKASSRFRVGYVRDDRRRSARAQRTLLTDGGIDRIYEDWALMIRQRRPGLGDILVVTDLWVIADPKRRTIKGGMRKSLMDRRAEARRADTTIVELLTGRSTEIPDEADAMLADALDTLANTRNRSKRIGRPPKVRSDTEDAVMRKHWWDRRHATNGDAVAAMAADGVRVSVSAVIRHLGPSGRKPGSQRK